MKKLVIIGLSIFSICISAFAGDAAVFVDKGFSQDGSVYVFGEYGKTDYSFQSYAEIYTVNVAGNVFVPGEVYRTVPSAATSNTSGKEAFEQLLAKNYATLKKYGCVQNRPDNLLYSRPEDAESTGDAISFKDFLNEGSSISYHIALVPSIKGSGIQTSSSFYISLRKLDANGQTVGEYTVGSPQIQRKGVTGYCIDKIFRDASGRNLVFVIEKTVEDASGTCIRYMVETIRL
ncbi:MAG: DUF2259 domain-containing protein [Treponema sp.]|nr:DUF2259 domain-containing protein [Treponema sp.]